MKREQIMVSNEELDKQLAIVQELKMRMSGKDGMYYYIQTFGCQMN